MEEPRDFSFASVSSSSNSANPDLITTSSGLQYEDIVVGLRPAVAAGQEVHGHYIGMSTRRTLNGSV